MDEEKIEQKSKKMKYTEESPMSVIIEKNDPKRKRMKERKQTEKKRQKEKRDKVKNNKRNKNQLLSESLSLSISKKSLVDPKSVSFTLDPPVKLSEHLPSDVIIEQQKAMISIEKEVKSKTISKLERRKAAFEKITKKTVDMLIDTKLKTPKKKTVLEKMESNSTKSGPMRVLYDSVKEGHKIKVWIRRYNGLRGVVSGYLIAFDFHMNLAMIDVCETYTIETWMVGQPVRNKKKKKDECKTVTSTCNYTSAFNFEKKSAENVSNQSLSSTTIFFKALTEKLKSSRSNSVVSVKPKEISYLNDTVMEVSKQNNNSSEKEETNVSSSNLFEKNEAANNVTPCLSLKDFSPTLWSILQSVPKKEMENPCQSPVIEESVSDSSYSLVNSMLELLKTRAELPRNTEIAHSTLNNSERKNFYDASNSKLKNNLLGDSTSEIVKRPIKIPSDYSVSSSLLSGNSDKISFSSPKHVPDVISPASHYVAPHYVVATSSQLAGFHYVAPLELNAFENSSYQSFTKNIKSEYDKDLNLNIKNDDSCKTNTVFNEKATREGSNIELDHAKIKTAAENICLFKPQNLDVVQPNKVRPFDPRIRRVENIEVSPTITKVFVNDPKMNNIISNPTPLLVNKNRSDCSLSSISKSDFRLKFKKSSDKMCLAESKNVNFSDEKKKSSKAASFDIVDTVIDSDDNQSEVTEILWEVNSITPFSSRRHVHDQDLFGSEASNLVVKSMLIQKEPSIVLKNKSNESFLLSSIKSDDKLPVKIDFIQSGTLQTESIIDQVKTTTKSNACVLTSSRKNDFAACSSSLTRSLQDTKYNNCRFIFYSIGKQLHKKNLKTYYLRNQLESKIVSSFTKITPWFEVDNLKNPHSLDDETEKRSCLPDSLKEKINFKLPSFLNDIMDLNLPESLKKEKSSNLTLNKEPTHCLIDSLKHEITFTLSDKEKTLDFVTLPEVHLNNDIQNIPPSTQTVVSSHCFLDDNLKMETHQSDLTGYSQKDQDQYNYLHTNDEANTDRTFNKNTEIVSDLIEFLLEKVCQNYFYESNSYSMTCNKVCNDTRLKHDSNVIYSINDDELKVQPGSVIENANLNIKQNKSIGELDKQKNKLEIKSSMNISFDKNKINEILEYNDNEQNSAFSANLTSNCSIKPTCMEKDESFILHIKKNVFQTKPLISSIDSLKCESLVCEFEETKEDGELTDSDGEGVDLNKVELKKDNEEKDKSIGEKKKKITQNYQEDQASNESLKNAITSLSEIKKCSVRYNRDLSNNRDLNYGENFDSEYSNENVFVSDKNSSLKNLSLAEKFPFIKNLDDSEKIYCKVATNGTKTEKSTCDKSSEKLLCDNSSEISSCDNLLEMFSCDKSCDSQYHKCSRDKNQILSKQQTKELSCHKECNRKPKKEISSPDTSLKSVFEINDEKLIHKSRSYEVFKNDNGKKINKKLKKESNSYKKTDRKSSCERSSCEKLDRKSSCEQSSFEKSDRKSSCELSSCEKLNRKSRGKRSSYEQSDRKSSCEQSSHKKLDRKTSCERSSYERSDRKSSCERSSYEKSDRKSRGERNSYERSDRKSSCERSSYEKLDRKLSCERSSYEKSDRKSSCEQSSHKKLDRKSSCERSSYERSDRKSSCERSSYEKSDRKSRGERSSYERSDRKSSCERSSYEKSDRKSRGERNSYERSDRKSSCERSSYEKLDSKSSCERSSYEKSDRKSSCEQSSHKKLDRKSSCERSSYERSDRKSSCEQSSYEKSDRKSRGERNSYERSNRKSSCERSSYDKLDKKSRGEQNSYEKSDRKVSCDQSSHKKSDRKLSCEQRVYEKLDKKSRGETSRSGRSDRKSSCKERSYEKLDDKSSWKTDCLKKSKRNSSCETNDYENSERNSNCESSVLKKSVRNSSCESSGYKNLDKNQEKNFQEKLRISKGERSSCEKLENKSKDECSNCEKLENKSKDERSSCEKLKNKSKDERGSCEKLENKSKGGGSSCEKLRNKSKGKHSSCEKSGKKPKDKCSSCKRLENKSKDESGSWEKLGKKPKDKCSSCERLENISKDGCSSAEKFDNKSKGECSSFKSSENKSNREKSISEKSDSELKSSQKLDKISSCENVGHQSFKEKSKNENDNKKSFNYRKSSCEDTSKYNTDNFILSGSPLPPTDKIKIKSDTDKDSLNIKSLSDFILKEEPTGLIGGNKILQQDISSKKESDLNVFQKRNREKTIQIKRKLDERDDQTVISIKNDNENFNTSILPKKKSSLIHTKQLMKEGGFLERRSQHNLELKEKARTESLLKSVQPITFIPNNPKSGLIYKKRYVNQLFVRGDNIIMVAYDKST